MYPIVPPHIDFQYEGGTPILEYIPYSMVSTQTYRQLRKNFCFIYETSRGNETFSDILVIRIFFKSYCLAVGTRWDYVDSPGFDDYGLKL